MDRWTEYELFVKVVELGSVTKAADALDLSSAAASRHLAALENRLGVRLIERSTRRLFVTEVGQAFYTQSKAALTAMQGATEAVSASKNHPAGVLRVTASLSLCLQHILPLVPRFKAQYPDVRLDIVAENRYHDIIDDNIDVALRTRDSEPDSSLVIRRLTDTRRLLAAAPDYLERCGHPEHPQALADHPLLLYTYASDPYELTFQRNDQTITVPVTPALESNDGYLLRSLALQGLGILAQPTYVIHDDIVAGRLVPVLCDWHLPRLEINLVYPSRRHLPAKTRVFIDFIVKHFQHLD
ncbi:LysR family transcriptional regulator [Pseudomonas sp. WS 5059]|uniref:LysR family transcriptional regulator n=1 Tax=unclassified Pseudomonas TaxID=196821 RepID=UPI001472F171|nr:MULTISPECIES: LysR family transcriptional regulator [unclassified Pseudomonas]NMX60625.1 LysR family transcriptional regulator [Pseudomonas sp. WS 5079]NMX66967.1 LysR family transcriptional regulator [Pseudomonas sp. WS 5111]NMX85031.1 LysR family transcriptional regulator [Pseudomonas sp. WS 5010]NMY01638.1 LysR family transcriptional regulator [Pseudomonas sp. WS 5059]NMY25834.1 LysR family transcriptional regulator [Pseudomonas sp. WS 5021]